MTLINLTGSEERPPQTSGSLLRSAAKSTSLTCTGHYVENQIRTDWFQASNSTLSHHHLQRQSWPLLCSQVQDAHLKASLLTIFGEPELQVQ